MQEFALIHIFKFAEAAVYLSYSQVWDSGRGYGGRKSAGPWPATQDWRQEADCESKTHEQPEIQPDRAVKM